MNLYDIIELAVEWCPRKARWDNLLDVPQSWGPAHELAHALIEPKECWDMESYGHCALGFCKCPRHRCDTYEIAAMRISSRLLAATGHSSLAYQEFDDTSGIDLIDPIHEGRATALLRRKKLWPVPRTKKTLEAALKRRLGKPRGGKQRLRRLL